MRPQSVRLAGYAAVAVLALATALAATMGAASAGEPGSGSSGDRAGRDGSTVAEPGDGGTGTGGDTDTGCPGKSRNTGAITGLTPTGPGSLRVAGWVTLCASNRNFEPKVVAFGADRYRFVGGSTLREGTWNTFDVAADVTLPAWTQRVCLVANRAYAVTCHRVTVTAAPDGSVMEPIVGERVGVGGTRLPGSETDDFEDGALPFCGSCW